MTVMMNMETHALECLGCTNRLMRRLTRGNRLWQLRCLDMIENSRAHWSIEEQLTSYILSQFLDTVRSVIMESIVPEDIGRFRKHLSHRDSPWKLNEHDYDQLLHLVVTHHPCIVALSTSACGKDQELGNYHLKSMLPTFRTCRIWRDIYVLCHIEARIRFHFCQSVQHVRQFADSLACTFVSGEIPNAMFHRQWVKGRNNGNREGASSDMSAAGMLHTVLPCIGIRPTHESQLSISQCTVCRLAIPDRYQYGMTDAFRRALNPIDNARPGFCTTGCLIEATWMDYSINCDCTTCLPLKNALGIWIVSLTPSQKKTRKLALRDDVLMDYIRKNVSERNADKLEEYTSSILSFRIAVDKMHRRFGCIQELFLKSPLPYFMTIPESAAVTNLSRVSSDTFHIWQQRLSHYGHLRTSYRALNRLYSIRENNSYRVLVANVHNKVQWTFSKPMPFTFVASRVPAIVNYFPMPWLSDKRAHCSLACMTRTDNGASALVRCLNNDCRAGFDMSTAPLTLDCHKLFYRSTMMKQRIFRGYVCDRWCAEAYKRQRLERFTLKKRRRDELERTIPNKKPRV